VCVDKFNFPQQIKGEIQMKQFSVLLTVFLILFILVTDSHSQGSTPIDITIDHDGVLLKGKFYVAEGMEALPTVILLQGFPGGEKDVRGIGSKLAQAGINALTFNYSGTHKSQGEFNFENTQKDIQAAFEFVHNLENIEKYKIDTTRIYLGGYSYGGGMALTYAANNPKITNVFSIAGNDHGEFFREYTRNPEMKKMIDEMFDNLRANTEIVRFGPGGAVKEFAEMKIIELNPTYDLRKCAPLLFDKNILLIGGWEDVNVSIENILLPLYRALKKEKAENVRFIVYHTNHSFSNVRDKLAEDIIEWIKRK
jgi:dipeptidyl aminopeptidase/acylaminoacyl peptidase